MTPIERSPSRLILVDSARVLAIVFMIQGHTLDVLLAPAYRHGFTFNTWLFLRGLTAPMFFILSGVSFTVASLRHWDSYLEFSPGVFRRVRRYIFFIWLGYVMHWPVKSYRNLKFMNVAGWQSWFQVDVLQCVGLTLLFLQILIMVAKTPKRFAQIAVGLCSGIILITPIVWAIDWSGRLPLLLASLLSTRTGSVFPLLPWSAYIFFGVGLGYLYTHGWSDAKSFSRLTVGGGATLAVTGLFFALIPVTIYPPSWFWTTSPNLFLIRVGCICFVLAILSFITQRVRLPEMTMSLMARESLTIYMVHICILYGSNWNDGLRQTIGATLSPLACLGWICVLVFSLMPLAWLWSRYKRTEPKSLRLARATALLVALVYSVS